LDDQKKHLIKKISRQSLKKSHFQKLLLLKILLEIFLRKSNFQKFLKISNRVLPHNKSRKPSNLYKKTKQENLKKFFPKQTHHK
jgi:hypothetical protein